MYLGAGAVRAESSQQLESDVALDAHGPRVDLEDVGAALEIGQAELDLAVEAARSHEGRVEGVRSVGRHEDLDVAARVEAAGGDTYGFVGENVSRGVILLGAVKFGVSFFWEE